MRVRSGQSKNSHALLKWMSRLLSMIVFVVDERLSMDEPSKPARLAALSKID